ncbi:type II toxin-antitoxin system CcdA family antitoxin [Pantoea cypripedii]|uniref:type II toxin-antitoxin system CcdA family antitoxin n=1 Tax=Pantoea TaxID=53335 RepID=UPI0028A93985|nr:type II toxin-antitoxin system CcdA family antitoxin [Pantoea sp.]
MPHATTKLRKQNVTLTLDPGLLQQAKDAGFSLSQLLAGAISAKLRETAAEKWKRENADAISDLNRHMAENGMFSDKHRKF